MKNQNKQKNKNSQGKLEKLLISRLRTNTGEFATVIRGALQDSNTGAVTAQGYSFLLNYPSYYRSPSGTFTQMPNITGILANEQKVFDEYKVIKLEVKYLPWVTNQARVNTSVAFTAPSDPTLLLTIDYDDSAVFTTYAKALSAQNPAIYHCYCGDGKMPRLVMHQEDTVNKDSWLNMQAIVPSASAAPDPNNAVGKLSALKAWKQGYQLASTAEGTFFAEWTIILRAVYTLA